MERTLKILHIIPSLGKGGAERYLIDLCLDLNKRKDITYRLLLLSPINEYEYLSHEIPFILMKRGPYIPSISKGAPFDNSEYKKIVDEFQPDIIHSHLFQAEIYTLTYVVPGVKYIVHCHDNMSQFKNLGLHTFLSKKKLTNFYEKFLLLAKKYKAEIKTYFITNSPHTQEYFLKNVPSRLKKNVQLIEYGFDFKRFFFRERGVPELNSKLKLINIGRFTPFKNQKFLVEVAHSLKKNNIDFELNLLGEGTEMNSVRDLINAKGLQNHVFLKGNVDYVEEWLKKSDIYLHAAYYEPFGLVLLEGMASGLPCIILNGKGNSNIINNHINGYMFNYGDPIEFAQKIIDLKNNPEMYLSISRNAQEFAGKYGISEKTDELINFYRSII